METSVVTVIGLGQDAIPERVSAHEKEIVTGVCGVNSVRPGCWRDSRCDCWRSFCRALTVAHPGGDVFPAESVATPQKD